jgi:nucleoside-diphosphate-sugar epimerase
MPFVFASSCSVYGPSQRERGLARGDSPTEATDVYTETKLAGEAVLRASPLAWVVLRIGAAIEGSAAATDAIVLRLMFEIEPDNPIELVHAEDVALAAARALVVSEAHRTVLPIGGGPSCRLTQRQLLETTLAAIGVSGGLPAAAFGTAPYYTSWLDSDQAQRLLEFQKHDFSRIRADVEARFAGWRRLLRPAAPLVRYGLLRLSGPYRGEPSRPTWRALIDAGY